MATSTLEQPKVVARSEWLAARRELLKKEKEHTRAYDELRKLRQELPWLKVEKKYVFDGPQGKETLADLFEGRSQLIVYHFMLGPGWSEGCVGCSFLADHIEGSLVHLEHHDVSLVVVSHAPLAEIEAYKRRMGWHFKWVSSFGSDFNYDYNVSFTKEDAAKGKVFYNFEIQDYAMDELPGTSAFYKGAEGEIFHTYSSYSRGGERLIGTYGWLDIAPKGRNENGPRHDMSDWMRHHDKYEVVEKKSSCCHSE